MSYPKSLNPSFRSAFLDKSGDAWFDIDNWMSSSNRLLRFGYPIPEIFNIEAANGVQVGTDFKDLHIRLQSSSSGNTDITANPQITTGLDGQNITIEGSHDTKTVTLKDGNGLRLEGGHDCVLGKNDTIDLYYNAIDSVWVEKSRNDKLTATLPIESGGTAWGGPLVNDRVMISNSGSIIESPIITVSELNLLNGMLSVSTGTLNNDKLVTQGYVDDAAFVVTGNLTESTSTVLTISGGTGAVVGSGTTLQVKQSSSLQSGYLSNTDWSTFNNKQDALTFGNLSASLPISVSGGTGSVIGSGSSLSISQATTSTDGYLSSTDWNTFNGKQDSLSFGNLTEATSSVLTIVGGTGSVIGSGTSIQVSQASTSTNGYLSSTDWNTFNNKQSALSLPLSVANGGTNSSTALSNDRVIISSSGAIVESSTITTTELGLLNGMTGFATGVSDNDKFATKGYVDDSIVFGSFSTLTDVTGAYTTANAIYRVNDDVDGLEETTIIVDEPASNQFQISSGTSALLVQHSATIDTTNYVLAPPSTTQYAALIGDAAGTWVETTHLQYNPSSEVLTVGGGTLAVSPAIYFVGHTYSAYLTYNQSGGGYFNIGNGLKVNGLGATIDRFDTDGTLTADSDTRSVTQKAVKTYVDTKVPTSVPASSAQYCILVANAASAWVEDTGFKVQSGAITTCKSAILDNTSAGSITDVLKIRNQGGGTTSTGCAVKFDTRGDSYKSAIIAYDNGDALYSHHDLFFCIDNASDNNDVALSDAAMVLLRTGDLQLYNDLMIGNGAAGVDYTLTFNGETNDGVLLWDEDNALFNFDSNLRLSKSTSPTLDFGSSYNFISYDTTNTATILASIANVDILIDSNNDSTTSTFNVKKNNTSTSSATTILSIAENNTLTIGDNDSSTAQAICVLNGMGTGSSFGGRIHLQMAADYDTTYDYWRIDAYNDTLRIGPTGTTFITMSAAAKATLAGSLDVTSYHSQAYGSYGYLNSSGSTGTSSGTNSYSITATYRISAQEFNAHSDERIKKDILPLDGEESLTIIKQLQPVDFKFKDIVGNGELSHKGFIAQSVNNILPDAVNTITGFIPDIYVNSQNISIDQENKELTISLDKSHELSVGDTVLIIAKSNIKTTVKKVISDTQFVVNYEDELVDKVFIYGRQVNDFMNLDYNMIFTIGIAAIKELSNKISSLEERITQLEQ